MLTSGRDFLGTVFPSFQHSKPPALDCSTLQKEQICMGFVKRGEGEFRMSCPNNYETLVVSLVQMSTLAKP